MTSFGVLTVVGTTFERFIVPWQMCGLCMTLQEKFRNYWRKVHEAEK